MTEAVRVVIVGAGPAGLAAGIASADGGAVLLEKNAMSGRKFLLSGSGQCNVTHGGPMDDFVVHFGDKRKARFVTPALFAFDNRATVRYFEECGVPMWERDDGKIFPGSLKSETLLGALLADFTNRGGTLRTETAVEAVRKIDGGFLVETSRESFRAEKLIVSTGGCSFPKTGSGGDGFRFAESFGHRIVSPRPALTPVYVRDFPFTDCSGIAFRQVKTEIVRNGKPFRAGRGDVLLTHHGLSGPGILDLSRGIEPGDELRVVVCPNAGNLSTFLTGKKILKNALSSLELPERFLVRLLETLKVPPDKPVAEVNREERKRLETALTGLPFVVEKLGGWNEAMATAGGVALDEVNRQTMESRLAPGLFFCGEVLDIDGDTGGYNIQFAISSGMLAGRSTLGR